MKKTDIEINEDILQEYLLEEVTKEAVEKLSEKVELFEKNFNLSLPNEYRQFIINTDGAFINYALVEIPGSTYEPCVNQIIGITEAQVEGLTWFKESYEDELLNDFVIIASGDDMIVMDTETEKIYFWDDGSCIPESEDGKFNIYKVADSFKEFIDNLKDIDAEE